MKLFNLDHQTAIVDHGAHAVKPGKAHEFTAEQIAAGITGLWSEQDPRAGLAAEREFKQRRDRGTKTAEPSAAETDTPAAPEKE